MTVNLTFYDCDPQDNTSIVAKVNGKEKSNITVTYKFTFSHGKFCKITHKYDNLFDFLFNPKKKYDFTIDTREKLLLEKKWSNPAIIESKLQFFTVEKDEELHNKLMSQGIPISNNVYNLYSSVNNKILRDVVKTINNYYISINEPILVKVNSCDHEMQIIITKIQETNSIPYNFLYKGRLSWNYTYFEWLSRDPHQLLQTLEFAARAHMDTNFHALNNCFNRAKYNLAHSLMPSGKLSPHNNSHIEEYDEDAKISVYICVSSSPVHWIAEISIIAEQQEDGWVNMGVYCETRIFEETENKLLDTLENNHELLSMLINDYHQYKTLIRECVSQLRKPIKVED